MDSINKNETVGDKGVPVSPTLQKGGGEPQIESEYNDKRNSQPGTSQEDDCLSDTHISLERSDSYLSAIEWDTDSVSDDFDDSLDMGISLPVELVESAIDIVGYFLTSRGSKKNKDEWRSSDDTANPKEGDVSSKETDTAVDHELERKKLMKELNKISHTVNDIKKSGY